MKAWLKIHGRALLLLPWIGLLLGMVLTGAFRNYVAGWHLYFQVMALAILGFAYLGTLIRGALHSRHAVGAGIQGSCSCGHDHQEHQAGGLSPLLVLANLTPLILFWAVGPATLSMQPRTDGALAGLLRALPSQKEAPEVRNFTPDGYLITDLARLHRDYKEKKILPAKVRLVGQIHTVPQNKLSTIPPALRKKGVRSYLYRFLISCCAADALPISVALLSEKPLAASPGQWFEVKGSPLIIKDKLEHIAVRVAALRQVPKPGNPYLFNIF